MKYNTKPGQILQQPARQIKIDLAITVKTGQNLGHFKSKIKRYKQRKATAMTAPELNVFSKFYQFELRILFAFIFIFFYFTH